MRKQTGMSILFTLHSLVRWIIVLVALVAVVKFAWGWMHRANPDKMDQGLMSGFSGLIDLQAALGLVFLIGNGVGGAGFPAFRLEHGFTMIVAAALAHLPARWRKVTNALVLRNNALVILGVLALIVVGVGVPLGWSRWLR